MTRYLYGSSVADFVIDLETSAFVVGASVTIWDAMSGGSQVTDLLDISSAPITAPVSDSIGAIRFYGPDAEKDTLWADTGVGQRLAIRPVNSYVFASDFSTYQSSVSSTYMPLSVFSTNGSILYRNNSGNISELSPGSTGEVLQIDGSGLPTWDTADAATPPQQIYSDLPVGHISMYGGTTLPSDGTWLWARGGTASRSEYPELFAKFQTEHGAGDGSTTFGLPDYSGRVVFGYKSDDVRFNSLASNSVGVYSTTLTAGHLPQHSHTMSHTHSLSGSLLVTGRTAAQGAGNYGAQPGSAAFSRLAHLASNFGGLGPTTAISAFSGSTGTTGSASPTAINNIPPMAVCNFIIKAKPTSGASRLRTIHPAATEWFGRDEVVSSNMALTLNRLYLIPIEITGAIKVDQFAFEVDTGEASSVVRMGLFNNEGTDGRPLGLIGRAASTTSTATSGVKSITSLVDAAAVSAPYLTCSYPFVWAGIVVQGASSSFRIKSAVPNQLRLPATSASSFLGTSQPSMYYVDSVSGSLSDISSISGQVAGPIPVLAFRRYSS